MPTLLPRYQVVGMLLLLCLNSGCSARLPECSSTFTTTWPNATEQIHQDISILTSVAFQGRKTATLGSQAAQDYIISRFNQLGLKPWQTEFAIPFNFDHQFSTITGVNLVATIPAKIPSRRWRIITAHYDHLGQKGSTVFPGADDNASGVAGMLAIAKRWQKQTHLDDVNLMLVATDAEEPGLFGSYALVQLLQQDPNIEVELSVNLDMIGHPNRRRAIYMEGEKNIAQFDTIKAQLMQQTQLCIRTHRRSLLSGRLQKTDWLRASDHYPFHKAGYKWVYFGVPPHQQYHTENDTIDTLDLDFIVAVVETVYQLLNIEKLTQTP
ncbi:MULTISPECIES: M20/M25/M40 family metallo-hydrolase [Shewanella]|jgi:Zn-dependent M28 family amino/carboxypeptidase|uniref:M20/M25/M40 family metallo-hydrolase n=2 Tax=Shewanellaceae TaxID=267890 RepID=UPI00200DFE4E|nr:M20/M25/M40 family metallo-hydrolase [Shewanella basaltis]MCL1113784.1 M20/M25/M40 family metallo-hydrolase [Shewanella basaltis]